MPYTETQAEQNTHNTKADAIVNNIATLVKEKHEAHVNFYVKHGDRG